MRVALALADGKLGVARPDVQCALLIPAVLAVVGPLQLGTVSFSRRAKVLALP